MKTLIIEDNPNDAAMVARWLEPLGSEITIAKTMAEAWAIIRASSGMEIILMDLGLPDAHAPEEEIAKIKVQHPNTLLVIFTGRASTDAEKFLGAGADAFIPKHEVTTGTGMLERLAGLVRVAVASPGRAGRHLALLEAVTRAITQTVKDAAPAAVTA